MSITMKAVAVIQLPKTIPVMDVDDTVTAFAVGDRTVVDVDGEEPEFHLFLVHTYNSCRLKACLISNIDIYMCKDCSSAAARSFRAIIKF